MVYDGYTTFRATQAGGILTVTFDDPPVNIQGIPMLNDLHRLAETLEGDRTVKVVVFQSAHPEIFVAHADTNFLKDMPAFNCLTYAGIKKLTYYLKDKKKLSTIVRGRNN